MGEVLRSAFQAVWNPQRLLELAILSLAWIVLGERKRGARWLLFSFAALYISLVFINTLCAALTELLPSWMDSPGLGVFHILWAAGLGVVSFAFMRMRSGLRMRTCVLVWLMLFTLQQATIALSG